MMTAPPEAALAISARSNFVLSDNGRYCTCMLTNDEVLTLESWTLTSEEARVQTVTNVAIDGATHALPLDDGRILLFQRGKTTVSEGHELTLLRPRGREFDQERLGAIPSLLWGYLLPSPSSAHLGFLVTLDSGHSTIWRIAASPPHIERVVHIPGSLEGGVWLDSDASVLAVNQSCGSYRPNGIVVDLVQGSWKRIWSRSVTSADRILLGDPSSKTIIVATTMSGADRLGWVKLDDQTVRFPEALHRPGYERRALTLDDRGERLLVHEVAGALSRLFVYTLADDRLSPLVGPPGKISSPACWTRNLIRFPFSSPTHHPTLATVRLGLESKWSLSEDSGGGDHGAAPQADLIELRGPAGPIEAIVYGGAGWRTCQHLVLALHGGPLSSWRFGFEPLFHCLATEGVAVVAPNYRGSTGYGGEHLRAVIGNWGGPDLDDVLELGRTLGHDRALRQLPRPVVLGASYGAFLALLAACQAPESWSACVALAPFLSGPRFYDSANAAVRRRIEQLGGLRTIENSSQPRDVLRGCMSLSAPLLIMHGVDDETIPVTQSRILREHLLQLGKTEGVDFEYAEVNSDHGGLLQRIPLNQRVVRFCLAQSMLDSNRQASRSRGRRRTRAPFQTSGKWNR